MLIARQKPTDAPSAVTLVISKPQPPDFSQRILLEQVRFQPYLLSASAHVEKAFRPLTPLIHARYVGYSCQVQSRSQAQIRKRNQSGYCLHLAFFRRPLDQITLPKFNFFNFQSQRHSIPITNYFPPRTASILDHRIVTARTDC